MANLINPLDVLLRAFPGIPKTEAEELVAVGEMRSIPAGTIICHENAVASTFYIILEGNVRVTKVIEHHQVRVLKTLGAGDFFGEMALIHNAPRAATVTATTATTVLEIRKEAFDGIMRRSASLAMTLAREVSRRLRENDAMAIEDLRMRASELAIAYQRLTERDYVRHEYLTVLAEQLRQPLLEIRATLDKNDPAQSKSADFQTAIEQLRQHAQQAMTLLNDILFMQDVDLILASFTNTDAIALLKRVINSRRAHAAQKQVEIYSRLPGNLPPVSADAGALERALCAVLDFAIQFSPPKSTVELEAWQENQDVRLQVRDQGPGIEAEALTHVFEPFFLQERNADQPPSLGLSIARRIIDQHHGQLEVNSQIGHGSTITVLLKSAL